MTKGNRYDAIIQRIFEERYRPEERRVSFERQAITDAAAALGIAAPKNLGDMLYTYRNRRALPEAVARCAPEGMAWEIRGTGRGTYAFVAVPPLDIAPSPHLAVTRIPNATPGMVSMYSLTDEQAMLARIRYNRLVDIFTRVTCYPLQSHLRTAVRGVQVETDDLYVGVDRAGAHYVLPVQAKGDRDRLGATQIEQDLDMCAEKFPGLICRPIGAQFTADGTIALFEFDREDGRIVVCRESQYALVGPDDWASEDLDRYIARARTATAEDK